MPLCILHTSVKDADIPADFEKQLAEKVSEVLTKPIAAMTVILYSGVRMFRKESTQPSCLLQISSIGVFDETRNPSYTPAILEFLRSHLCLDENRAVVQFLSINKIPIWTITER